MNPGIDQISLAAEAALDPSTTADVLRRLADRGLVFREIGSTDKRSRTATLTKDGQDILAEAEVLAHSAREKLMEPLEPQEQEQFLSLAERLLAAHETGQLPWSRSPNPKKFT